MAIFGNMSGDYMGLGNILKDSPEIALSEAFFKSEHDGKCLTVYGVLADDPTNSKLEIKFKDKDSDKWEDYQGKLVRFETPLETFEKEYNGKKTKKEATPQSAFIGKHLMQFADNGKFYKMTCDLGASEDYLTAIETGLTKKGTQISDDLKQEFFDAVVTVEEIPEAPTLASAKLPEPRKGGSRVSQSQILDERLTWLTGAIQNENSETLKQLEEVAIWLEAHPNKNPMTTLLALLFS